MTHGRYSYPGMMIFPEIEEQMAATDHLYVGMPWIGGRYRRSTPFARADGATYRKMVRVAGWSGLTRMDTITYRDERTRKLATTSLGFFVRNYRRESEL